MTPEQRSHLRYLIFQAEQSFDNPHNDTLDPSIKNLTLRQVEDIALDYVEGLLKEKDAEIERLKASLRDAIAIGPNRQSEPMPAIFKPLDNPTPLSEVAIWWLNGHSDNETIIDEGHIEHLPKYIAGEVYSLHGRPTRGRLWVPSEIQLNEIQWDDNKPRAKECANRGGIVFWRKDIDLLKGLPGFVTDTQMNEISRQ